MDTNEIISYLRNKGLYSEKGKTQSKLFAMVNYKNFDTQQVDNRSSASWKTAKYILVDDCDLNNIDFLLNKWRSLAACYCDQYLFVFNNEKCLYEIYNWDGELLFDDTHIDELFGPVSWNWHKGDALRQPSQNIIFYGIPGCGKSHYIEYDILGKDKKTKAYTGEYKKSNIIRTTFYQDYSNTDFVGQILPKIVKGANGEKDTVEYIFNPGPFTLALIRAISSPNEKVALIVEEINRGNAPAIFGDIFQLLDRDDCGISEYGITNVGLLDYLNSFEFDVEGEKKRYTFNEIKIPGNMDIFATMNTSDQNVYTLDTAFTRRWSKERIPNDFNGNEIKDCFVPGMYKYTWEEFVFSVNKQIQDKLDDLQVNEDKQVGAFFVKKADLLPKDASSDDKEKAKAFAYKVLEYLWDDVSKLDHTVIFNPSYKTFESLVEAYLKNGVTVFNREIFKEKTEDSMLENSLEE